MMKTDSLLRSRGTFRFQSLQRLSAILCAVAILLPWLVIVTRAQEPQFTPRKADTSALQQALLDLTNPWTVMCVAAHPDDEDGTTLTVLRRKHGVHTVSLFSTYGEGGQNAVGPELYEELGVIRARETIAASRIQGSQPHFLGLKDFGFSKSAAETFKVWGHDEALRRMVLKIRELRPDVIITNHDTARGHGHHQATGQLIIEAFDAAADPVRFPEQLNKVKTWQAQRLFVRVGGPGAAAAAKTGTPEKIVSIDPNEIDSVRDVSYAEQALSALQQHASQGPWPKTIEELLKARGIQTGKLAPIRYQLVREAAQAPPLPATPSSLIENLKPSPDMAERLKLLPAIDLEEMVSPLGGYDKILDALANWRTAAFASTQKPEDDPRRRLVEERTNNALAQAAGLSLSVTADQKVLIPGRPTTLTVTLANEGNGIVVIKKLALVTWGKEKRVDTPEQLLPDTDTGDTVEVTPPESVKYTVPYSDHLYDGTFLGEPARAVAEVQLDGVNIPLKAETRLDVTPAVEIKSLKPSPYLFTPATLNQPLSFLITVTNHQPTIFEGSLIFSGPPGQGAEVGPALSLAPGETREITARSNIIPRDTAREERLPRPDFGAVLVEVKKTGQPIPVTQRSVRVKYVNAKVSPGLRVGYLPSFDETLKHSLATLGVESTALSPAELQSTDLSVYHTIVIDNRAYEAHPALIAANSKLLEFVNAGGTMIVFYHKPNEWNPDPTKNRPQLAPYPIVLGDDRVTDETAFVRFLQPRHPLLNFPNRIGQADFKDWIQERGLYYPKEWDNQYTALFSMNDKGEKPLRSGLLVGRHGKGNYIYTSMVWYRQLRAGVPGGYRMFANLISYGKKP